MLISPTICHFHTHCGYERNGDAVERVDGFVFSGRLFNVSAHPDRIIAEAAMLHFVLVLQIPALDRLLSYLEAQQQAQIDSLVAQVTALTQQLKQHSEALQGAVDKG